MFCKICKNANSYSVWTTTGSEWLKEDCIERHQQSKKHTTAINVKNSDQLTIKESFMQQMNHNQALIICCMRNVYYLTQRNIALNNYESLCDLITYQINYQNQTGMKILFKIFVHLFFKLILKLQLHHLQLIIMHFIKMQLQEENYFFLYLLLLKKALLLRLKNHHVGVYLLMKVIQMLYLRKLLH